MAIWNGRPKTPKVLEAALRWRQECLLDDGGMFSSESLWTVANLEEVRSAFLGNLILGSDKFIDKLEQQVRGCAPAAKKLSAETLWLLLLFVSENQMGARSKRDRIFRIWSLTGEAVPDSPLLSDDVLIGVAKPGAAFMTKMPDELGYLLSTIHAAKQLGRDELSRLLSDPWGFGKWVDEQGGSDRRGFRHMLLYLCFPESYERISSWRHKRRIREACEDRIPAQDRRSDDWTLLTTDRVLLSIRESLEQEFATTELDFYLPPLRLLWQGNDTQVTGPDEDAPEAQRFWIEKTIVAGRPDREHGEHSVGKAIWSPQKSKSGGDIYANMRRVKPGDVIFHLTDNQALTGVSLAAAAVDDTFVGLAGTDWEGAGYKVQLSNYQRLDPPLPRTAFLETEPFSTELRELAASGAKGLFYNSHLELNQGAYLTEATPTLLAVLSRAYHAYAGKALPNVERPLEVKAPDPHSYTVDNAAEGLFLDRKEIEEILLLWTVKKNVILQGPPGVGKSFAAQRLAFARMGAEDPERLAYVQFHQSYSYEDFVEGYRSSSSGFELRTGKFVEFCRRAEADPGRTYVFIVDEINRGNLSKILGELLLLIESDKRDPKWAISLASSKLPFHVPANVNIMGLMNTADRSLAVVDYALRRRFAFINLHPKLGSSKLRAQLLHTGVPASAWDSIIARIGSLNDAIISDTANLGPGFAIGHSYFCTGPTDAEDAASWYGRVIRTEIAPLLREYWFDAPQKARSWEDQLLAPL